MSGILKAGPGNARWQLAMASIVASGKNTWHLDRTPGGELNIRDALK